MNVVFCFSLSREPISALNVLTSKMGRTASHSVLKVCKALIIDLCGRTQTKPDSVSHAILTAHKGRKELILIG